MAALANPPYIFGMHDRGAEAMMHDRGRPGWVVLTEAIGADPENHAGADYRDLSDRGLGVIVRLNYGYGTDGTIPHSSQYPAFAQRCGHFVAASPGCHRWIIGNEMNLAFERPRGLQGGEPITPAKYARCFVLCRQEITRRPGHEGDLVIVGAVGPWNNHTRYPGNERGSWIQYFRDILDALGELVGGIALHTYTHGQDPALITSDETMAPPFDRCHWHFRAYRDFMQAIPPSLQDRPVFITEADQYGDWRNENTGWVQGAYKEIDTWNRDAGNQPIQALVLYRWIVGNYDSPQEVGWAIENKEGVKADFLDAMRAEYWTPNPRQQNKQEDTQQATT